MRPLSRISSILCLGLVCGLLLAHDGHATLTFTDEEQAYLKQKGVITFVSQSNYPPFEFRDADGHQDGMTIELAHWLATELGFRAKFLDMTFQEAQQAVLSGQGDVITSLFYSSQRDRSFDFTQTLFEVPASIFVPVERPDIIELSDLNGKRIAIQRGDYAKSFLEEEGIDFQMVPTRDFAEATEAVIKGRADAIIGDEQIVLYFLFSHNLQAKVKKVGKPLYIGHNCMAVKDGNLLLLSILDKGFTHARESGILSQLNQKWLGRHYPERVDYWGALWPYLAATLGLVLLIGAWNLRLRRAVAAKTRELANSEQRLHYALEGANDGLWDWNMQTDEVFYSPRWQSMLGYPPGEIKPVFQSWVELLHPDDHDAALEQVERLRQDPAAEYAASFRMRDKAGNWQWLLSRGKVVERDQRGRPLRAVGTHQNITRQKEVEAALRESEERYRQVVDNLKEVVFQTNTEGLWTFLNPAWTEITGFAVADSIGTLFLDYIHPEDRARNLELFQPLIEQKKDYCRHEIRYLTKDDGFRWIEVFARLTLGSNGESLGTSGTLTDISERKEAETALRESEERFQRMFREHGANMLLIDPETGSIIDANRAACRFYGYSTEEFKQLDISQINLLPQEQIDQAMAQALSRSDNQFEFPHRLASGEIRTVQVHSSQIELRNHTVLFSIIRDVTGIREAEQQLQLQAVALNSVANAILITDRDGVTQWANPAFCKLSGYSLEETLGQKPQELVRSGRQPDSFYQILWQTILSGQPWHGELVNRRKDGSTYEEELTITPVLSEAGEIEHFIAVKQDISERKKLQREREQAQEQLFHAQKLDSLGRLAGGIAHDLNNLLVPIIGYSEIALRKFDSGGQPLKPLLQQIHKAGLQASSLINQILAFGRRQHLDRRPCDLNQTVLGLEQLLGPLLRANVNLEMDLAGDLPQIQADCDKLEQALVNLCINASDAMPTGGSLKISTFDRKLTDEQDPESPQHQVCVSISDTGHGIDPVTRKKILDPFFTTKKSGSGLGLSTVLGIVEQHGGQLQIESELGKGSTFRLYFPVTKTNITEVAKPETAPILLAGDETILLVDDEEQVRQTTGEILRDAGYRALEAASAELAMQIINNPPFPINLVLTDITMPQMNGYQLANRLKENGFDKPIAFMSGYSYAGLGQVQHLRDEQFIQKPFQSQDLLKFVRQCLDIGNSDAPRS